MAEEWRKATSRDRQPPPVNSAQPNVARTWNVLIGGRDNFEADRRAARHLVAAAPVLAQAVAASRAFLRRAMTYLTAEAGLRQFLDIGPGIPAAGNTHEVAQAADPSCRIVYVDNDPVVLAHARARLRSAAPGATSFVDADARDTEAVIAGARGTLDLGRPVGLIMIGILNFLPDAGEVAGRTLAALPSGSYLAVLQAARDDRLAAAAERWNQLSATPVFLRDRDQVASWLGGLDLVDPGLVEVDRWRPAPGDPDAPGGVPLLGAVARKP